MTCRKKRARIGTHNKKILSSFYWKPFVIAPFEMKFVLFSADIFILCRIEFDLVGWRKRARKQRKKSCKVKLCCSLQCFSIQLLLIDLLFVCHEIFWGELCSKFWCFTTKGDEMVKNCGCLVHFTCWTKGKVCSCERDFGLIQLITSEEKFQLDQKWTELLFFRYF